MLGDNGCSGLYGQSGYIRRGVAMVDEICDGFRTEAGA